MSFLKNRKSRKEIKESLHVARQVRRMHEDIANPDHLQSLRDAETCAKLVRNSGTPQEIETALVELEKACNRIVPPGRKDKKIRENVEIIIVSIAAAMGIRAYFFQPFKIPTGSMQPTLYGITMQEKSTLPMTNPLFRAANMILFGEKEEQSAVAKVDGVIQMGYDQDGNRRPYYQPNPDHTLTVYIETATGRVPHVIQAKLAYDNLLRVGETLKKGESLARTSVRKSGDYILVNRMKFNFIPPKRGDITVFDTVGIEHPQVRACAYYIKRMVELPGEAISVAVPEGEERGELRVDGKRPENPRFEKIFTSEDYSGYHYGSKNSTPLPFISKAGDEIQLADDEVLFFGDNTVSSLDGRYFGAVKRKRILGPAFFVCWPLDRAGFAEIHH